MSDETTDLTFTDGASAFEYSCQCLDCTVELKKPLPALVLDAREHFGQATATKINEDGTQTVVLRGAEPGGWPSWCWRARRARTARNSPAASSSPG